MIHILGRDRSQIWPDFEISQARDLDLDLRWLWNSYCCVRLIEFYTNPVYTHGLLNTIKLRGRLIVTASSADFEVAWHVTRERYRKSSAKKVLYRSLVSESLVSSHQWFISRDEIDRKVGRISISVRLVTLTLTFDQGQTGTACTTHCPLLSTKVSFKSETKKWMDRRT